jgi:Rrf2 family nitric oxide-sensitive transcriptional repressor
MMALAHMRACAHGVAPSNDARPSSARGHTGCAKRLDITQLNVFKIVHLLSRAGFVEAARGRYGGVRLTRAPSQIRVGEVVRAMENTEIEVAGAETHTRRKQGDAKPQINFICDDALEAFIGVLDQNTLADRTATGRRGLDLRPAQKRPRTTKAIVASRARPAVGRSST